MKILFCTPTFQTITHGPAKFAQFVSQINELYPDHQVKIITEDYEGEPREDIYNISLYCPRPFHAFIHFFRAVQYHHKARALRKQFPFDVIVYNNAILGIWSALRWRKKIPVIGLLNDNANLQMSWRADPDKLLRKWAIRLLFRYFEQLSVQKLRATIVNSNFLKKETILGYKIESKNVYRLYKTVNIEHFNFETRKIDNPNGLIRVLFVKNDFQCGGLWVLLEALQKLDCYFFELVIIGPLATHRQKINQRGEGMTNVSINFLGSQLQAVVREYMRKCDILCIPSLREGLGVANIEGLAAGIAVVSTKAGGIPEVLGEGAYGWLAEVNDANSLADTLKHCIVSPCLRKQKSEAGRLFVQKHFQYKDMLDRFINILSSSLVKEKV